MEYRSVGLEGILVDQSQYPYVGKERKVRTSSKDIKCFSDGESYRFLLMKDGIAVSGIQLMTRDGIEAVVANVYTLEGERRKGYARTLFNEAKKRFNSVEHSRNLGELGRAFAGSVN